jgi:quercetin dioxygenase-like cupin family protein
MRNLMAVLCVGAYMAAMPALAQAPASPASGITRTILGKTEVPGGTHEVVSARVEIAPGFKAGRHFHNGLVQVTVLEGEFWLALDGQPEKNLTAGQSFEVPLKAIHNEGAVGALPVKLFAVFIVEKGKPLAEMVK